MPSVSSASLEIKHKKIPHLREDAGFFRFGLALLGFAFRAENVEDFVLVKLLHFVAGRTEIFAGVELSGLGGEHLAHG